MSSSDRYIHEPTLTWPVKESTIKSRILEQQPNISFAKPFVPPAEYKKIQPAEQPAHDAFFQTADEVDPVKVNGQWVQQWSVRSATAEELLARQALLKAEITAATQQRLDDFARTRNYDGILSACTYASSTVTKFRNEGQYCVDARDATWAKLYQIMDEADAGTRPVPTGYADIEPELPVLAWPAA